MENKEQQLIRKPSIRKKPLPPVRETLTSRIRLLKADPLLAKELGIKDLNKLNVKDVKNNNLLDCKLKSYINQFGDKKTIQSTTSNNNRQDNVEKNPPRPPTAQSSKHVEKPVTDIKIDKNRSNDQKPKNHNNTTISMFQHSQQFLSSTKLTGNKTKKIDYIKQNIEQASKITKIKTNNNQQLKNQSIIKKNGKPTTKPAIRRSLSAQHFDRKNGKRSEQPEKCFIRMDKKTQSFNELRNVEKTTITQQISPVIEEQDLTFKTPSAYQRRSILTKTPLTTHHNNNNNNNRLFVPFASTPTPYNLQKRLIEWLEKRGKTLHDFQHLKCFGGDAYELKQTNTIIDEKQENDHKENIEIVDDSYENLQIPPQINVENVENENVAKGVLIDLQNLLIDGYPYDQCEIWLYLIEQKFNQLHNEPDYWEIRALIEQARGNLTTAVECYQTAIIQGAEIRNVDESLENLLQKFSLLNISPKCDQQTTNNKERQRIIQDARNVFKSSIIQFAVKERTLKKTNKNHDSGNGDDGDDRKFVMTPVRRSTRLSRCKYTSTPGVKIYSSLKEVESPIRNNLDFKSNTAL